MGQVGSLRPRYQKEWRSYEAALQCGGQYDPYEEVMLDNEVNLPYEIYFRNNRNVLVVEQYADQQAYKDRVQQLRSRKRAFIHDNTRTR